MNARLRRTVPGGGLIGAARHLRASHGFDCRPLSQPSLPSHQGRSLDVGFKPVRGMTIRAAPASALAAVNRQHRRRSGSQSVDGPAVPP